MYTNKDDKRAYMRQWSKTTKAKDYRRRWLQSCKGKAYVSNQNKRRAKHPSVKAYRQMQKTKKALSTKAWLDSIKLASGCVDCGYNAHPAALDFDHINPSTKLFCISHRRQCSKDVLEAEVHKCEIRCANCHRVKTYRKPQ